MFLVEKDSYVEPKGALNNNLTNLMTASSITNLIDTDRHKFETFADALWWGIVCHHSLVHLLRKLNNVFFFFSIRRSLCAQ